MALQRDMTVGNPMKIILQFAIPVFIGNVFQQIYAMCDTIIVGKFVGTKALAGVGATGTINFLILGFLIGLTTGFAVPVAQRFGAGDYSGLKKTVGNAGTLSLLITVLITILSVSFMDELLLVMNTPEDIIDMSYDYIIIISAGLATQVLYNLLSAILRALGNSRTPLYFLILSASLNIVLDLVLIIYVQMGVAGAAYATVISQGVSGVLCLVFIARKVPLLHVKARDFALTSQVAGSQLKLGLPMAFQFSITAIGTMIVQVFLNLLGSITVAAFTAGVKIEQLMTQAFVAEGTAMATYCGQNIGAGKKDRVRQGVRASMIQSVTYAIVIGIILALSGKYMTYLFISEDVEQVFPMVEIYLRCCSGFFIPLSVIFIFRNALQGMGYGMIPMIGGVIELIARVIVAVIAGQKGSYLGICMASPTAWIAAAVYLVAAYLVLMSQGHGKEKNR